MTSDQEAHLQRIKVIFVTEVDDKYRKGQAEHGGNLFDLTPLDLVNNALLEALDQVVYLVTLRDRLRPRIDPRVRPEV